MARISSDEIFRDEKYRLIETLRYDEIVPFVFRNIRNRNIPSMMYYSINLAYFVLLVLITITGFKLGEFTRSLYFSYLGLGVFCGSILIIPFHELFHGIAYKLVGAPKINYGADFRQMLFYVAADRFVINSKEFAVVALAPFIMINLAFLLLMIFLPAEWMIFFLSLLLFHNIMCIGDFAMLSYFSKNSSRKLYTFDDQKQKISYIFALNQ